MKIKGTLAIHPTSELHRVIFSTGANWTVQEDGTRTSEVFDITLTEVAGTNPNNTVDGLLGWLKLSMDRAELARLMMRLNQLASE